MFTGISVRVGDVVVIILVIGFPELLSQPLFTTSHSKFAQVAELPFSIVKVIGRLSPQLSEIVSALFAFRFNTGLFVGIIRYWLLLKSPHSVLIARTLISSLLKKFG